MSRLESRNEAFELKESPRCAAIALGQWSRTSLILAVLVSTVAIAAIAIGEASAHRMSGDTGSSILVNSESELSIERDQQTFSGVIEDTAAMPIGGALVQLGGRVAISGPNGVFKLHQETHNEPREVFVAAAGYQESRFTPPLNRWARIQLEQKAIKAVYANGELLATPGGIERLIAIADTTEINAIVLDIKESTIFYDSQVAFFRDVGSIAPLFDVRQALELLKTHGIYTIARMVVFQDPFVAEARPELAVRDELTGGLWRNDYGVAWVNAFEEELWSPNIELALEAVGLGFDEIQYDYVRFPSDGDLSRANFGREYTAEARQNAITEFVKRSYEQIQPTGAKLAADLFGFVTLVDDEQFIGQRFKALAPYLDYICMMIYPSHFIEGNIASAPGHPNDYPYETILESLQRAEENVPGSKAKFRPWLQDFDYPLPDLRGYTPADVRAQIDAAEEFGTAGWMLWGDPFHVSISALAPERVT